MSTQKKPFVLTCHHDGEKVVIGSHVPAGEMSKKAKEYEEHYPLPFMYDDASI